MCNIIEIIVGLLTIGSIFLPLLIFRKGKFDYLNHQTKAILILSAIVCPIIIISLIYSIYIQPFC